MDPILAETSPYRVLVCDGDVVDLMAAHRILHLIGCKPDLAGNGLAALQALDQHAYDLILMDVDTPELDGLEATRRIRERERRLFQRADPRPPLIIVGMSAGGARDIRVRCLTAGMDDYIPKPLNLAGVGLIIMHWRGFASAPQGA
jgi:CheY-like chemotaxis protein